MAKTLTMTINKCEECPYYFESGSILDYDEEYCSLLDRKLVWIDFKKDEGISSFCPLEET